MPIATSLAAVVFASSLAGAAPVTASLPPIAVDVTIAPDVPVTLVTRVLEETDAVWRASGLTFVWNRHRADRSITIALSGPAACRALDVVIGHNRGAALDIERESKMALGWIVFDGPDVPAHEIYLSYENALAFMAGSRAVVGVIEQMTLAEREMKLARAMGRALAHEIGHYLLASKGHTRDGLMQAVHTASEFFGYQRTGFAIDAAQRQTVADRLRHQALVASR
jgi:hypothetical protein